MPWAARSRYFGGLELGLLLGVAEVGDLDEHGRHLAADEDPERPALDAQVLDGGQVLGPGP